MLGRPALWAARHAPARAAGVCYGRRDVEVTVEKVVAAHGLATALPREATRAPVVVWASPAARCRQVAACLAETMNARFEASEALHELDFGAWEGRTWEAIATEDAAAYEVWSSDWAREAPPGGEALPALEDRVSDWVRALDASCTHLLIAHAGVVRALRVLLEGESWDEAMRAPVPHLTWARFGAAGAGPDERARDALQMVGRSPPHPPFG